MEYSICKNCKIEFGYYTGQGKGIFCSRTCRDQHGLDEYIAAWKAGEVDGTKSDGCALSNHVRRYVFEKYDSKCMQCNWSEVNPKSGKIPLHIDHIDGNAENNREENLRLLCPNCHSLTPTFGALNIGNGSRKRLKKYKLI